jgi:hypothetical protein
VSDSSSRGRTLLEGLSHLLGRVPEALSGQVTVDVARRRLRLSHERVEALTRRLLRDVRHLEVGDWSHLPHAYDVRMKAGGFKLRVDVALERVELIGGRYHLTLRTPGRVDLEEGPMASVLMGMLRYGAGTDAMRALLEKVLPPGLRWDGRRFLTSGRLPKEGAAAARLFETSALVVNAEHTAEGVWFSAEEWPGLLDLVNVLMGMELPRTPPGHSGR